MGDAQDAGLMGAVARRERELRESEQRQLTGHAGKALYLEALQLILRGQVLFLVRDKGHSEELETVCRDLWDLRLRGANLHAAEDNRGQVELEMFSSQPSTEDEHPKAPYQKRARAQSWDPDRGQDWPMPTLTETAALCYLSCLLLRFPTRLGTMHKWITNGHMPFTRAVGVSFSPSPPQFHC